MSKSFFNSLDYFYIGLVFISSMIGFTRGFVKDFFSTCAWIGSGFLSAFISPYLSHSFQAGGMGPTVAKFTAIGVSYAVLLITFLLTIGLVSQKVKNTVLSGVDGALGCLFGFGRGIIILITMCIIAVMFDILEKDYKFINNSKLTPYLLEITDELMPKIIQWTPRIEEKPKKEDLYYPVPEEEKVEEFKKGESEAMPEKEEMKKAFLVDRAKKYVASIFTRYFERREGEGVKDEVSSIRRESSRHKIVKNKDANVEFGCMDLMKARAKRRAQKKAEKLKREIIKHIDKRP